MPWMNGQTKPMVKAAVTGRRKSHQKCLVDFIWELCLMALLFMLFHSRVRKERGPGAV